VFLLPRRLLPLDRAPVEDIGARDEPMADRHPAQPSRPQQYLARLATMSCRTARCSEPHAGVYCLASNRSRPLFRPVVSAAVEVESSECANRDYIDDLL
jgi:hypothetical protein